MEPQVEVRYRDYHQAWSFTETRVFSDGPVDNSIVCLATFCVPLAAIPTYT